MATRKNEAAWIESRQRWQIKVQKDGVRKTFTSNLPGKKGKIAAERAADYWLDEGLNPDRRFGDVWAEFMAYKLKYGGKSDYRLHEQMGRLWLLPRLQKKRLSSITDRDWQNCIDAGYDHGLSKKSLKNMRGSMTAFYGWCKKGKLPLDKPDDIVIPKDAHVGVRKIVQPNQLKILFTDGTMLHRRKQREAFFIHAWRFEVLTGMRPGEVAGLQRGKDIDDQLVQIHRAINQYNEVRMGGKNENAVRVMALFRQLRDVLDAQDKMLKNLGIRSMWLFPGEDGGAMDTNKSYRRWRRYREQKGITSSLYELRHTMVSILKNDMPDNMLKRIVGHSKSMDTYGVYGHAVDGELTMAAEIMERVFDRFIGNVGT